MPCTVAVGGFYGDEGKGKILSYLSIKDSPELAVRGGVGANAGHTFFYNKLQYKVRMLPSAVLCKSTRLLIGAGVLVTPSILFEEIRKYSVVDKILVDNQCGVIDNSHILRDSDSKHLREQIGTTGSGTGPANSDRALRTLKLARDIPDLHPYLGDVSETVNDAIEQNKLVLVEGTQGTYLSLYHGGYPYVTSKDVTASGICSDIGLGPKKVDHVLVVFKSFVTRVGSGPLPNEVNSEEAVALGWEEYGSVTGRLRRSSSFNMELAKRSVMINSATQLAITKLDILFPSCAGIRKFIDLPSDAKKFVQKIQDETRTPVVLIGTGEDVFDIIDLRNRDQ